MRFNHDFLMELKKFLGKNPDLHDRYNQARFVVRLFRRPAFYEISTKCNVKCEGCYYYETDEQPRVNESDSLSKWDAFFASESARGVSMAYFVGAEPALEQERLNLAAKHFKYGNIGTNGSILIDRSIPFRVSISVWGSDASDEKNRGARIYRKAIKNYTGDSRAIFLYTVNKWNVQDIFEVAEMCNDSGLLLTFNIYSPTQRFLSRLDEPDFDSNNRFFRISSIHDNPCLSDEDLLYLRDVIDQLIDNYPDTIVYTRVYNKWSTESGSRYLIDPNTGFAQNCSARIIGALQYYTADLQTANLKCCTPGIDCRFCRIYSAGWSSKLELNASSLVSREAFVSWLEMIETIGRIFFVDIDSEKGSFF